MSSNARKINEINYSLNYVKEHSNKNCFNCSKIIENPTQRKYCDACIKIKQNEAGLKSAASQQRRSKNEIAFADLCMKEFPRLNITTNETFFKDKNGGLWDADVIIHDLKIAIMWNGNWHRLPLRKDRSLLQIQTRDKIKMDAIQRNGYTVYVIDDYGKYDLKFVQQEFDKFFISLDKS